MKILIFTVLVIFLLISNLSRVKSLSNESPKKLISLHVVFRHGARTSTGGYPKDPYINETFYPYDLGQMNNYGKQQVFQMGTWLRKKYEDFLGNLYQFDEVYAQSTDVPRTKSATAVLLAGLYPPAHTILDWNYALNWQPIPIYSAPLDTDMLLYYLPVCPRYFEARDELWQLPEVRKPYNDNKEMFTELTKHTGFPFEDANLLRFPIQLFSTLETEKEFGLQLPKWTDGYFPNRLLPFYELGFMYNSWTIELKRLKGGTFVQKLISDWSDKISNNDQMKISLFGGHDYTISFILGALNVWTPQIPVYGIMAVFELLQDEQTGIYGVQMYQKVPGNDTVKPLILPGCEYFCPIQQFIDLTKNIIPVNITLECIPRDPNYVVPNLN